MNQLIVTIDYRDNMWLVCIPKSGDCGFWTLAAAWSFAINNLNAEVKWTNKAILQKVLDNQI